jgi:glycosyltransferase involved in cell wall biosynthesis
VGATTISEISVVIAVHNFAATLEQCLQALVKSTVKPLECLVVDDASTDDAQAVAARNGVRLVVLEKRVGPARARNTGAREARGDVILFLDADVCIHDDTMMRILEHFKQQPSIDAVIGAYDDSPAVTTFISQYRNLLHCFTHRSARREASTFWTGCGAIRKEAFLRCGGMDEGYGHPAIEDIEFGSRLKAGGGRILLDAAIQVKHLKHWTFTSMLRTDIFQRGVPWTRLILRSGSMPNDLNVRWSQRLSVALVFLLIALLGMGEGNIAAICAIALAGLNLPFYTFLLARGGAWFMLRAVPLHFFFHLYCGAAFALGVCGHLWAVVKPRESEVPGEEPS